MQGYFALIVVLASIAVGASVTNDDAPNWPDFTKTAALSGPLNLLTILGDSYSDLGSSREAEVSLFSLSGGKLLDPQYFPNRMPTNGLNWGAFLSKSAPGLNVRGYAVGGATMCQDYAYHVVNPQAITVFPKVPSIPQQVSLYLQDTKTRVLPSQRAVAIWAGTNDVFSGLMNDPDGEGPQPPVLIQDTEGYTSGLARCLEDSVNTLLDGGERQVVVLNVGPLEDLPRMAAAVDLMKSSIMPLLNAKIKRTVAKLQEEHPEASITLLDIYSNLKAAASTPEALGLVDVSTPCISPANPMGLSANPYMLAGPACRDANQHLFSDPVHYSSTVQEKVIAKAVAEHLNLSARSGSDGAGCGGKAAGEGQRVGQETCSAAV